MIPLPYSWTIVIPKCVYSEHEVQNLMCCAMTTLHRRDVGPQGHDLLSLRNGARGPNQIGSLCLCELELTERHIAR